jgi:hypothetical protein
MKAKLIFALLVVNSLLIDAHASTNTPGAFTNILAFHLVVGEVPYKSLTDGKAAPDGLKLTVQPILSDADFVAWNVTNHTFVITPTAAKRVAGRCEGDVVPFVLMCDGEPIYLGIFGTWSSSFSPAVPVILTDNVLPDCFMGWTNVPRDAVLWTGDITERLMAMTNATTNVTLKIDRGYPVNEYEGGMDKRDDKRIVAAVEKLFGNRKH